LIRADYLQPSKAFKGEELPPGSHWVTINGAHVLIDGDGNVISGAGGNISEPVTPLERDLKKSQKEQLPVLYPASMPDEARAELEKFEVVSKSPYSDSFYDITNKGWDDNPEGSLRMSDHWNFTTNDDKLHEMTDIAVPSDSWTLAKLENGKYRVIGNWPKLGEDGMAANRLKTAAFRLETSELKKGHIEFLNSLLVEKIATSNFNNEAERRLDCMGVLGTVQRRNITEDLIQNIPEFADIKPSEEYEPGALDTFIYIKPALRSAVERKLGGI